MMNYQKINVITGWIVWIIASLVYFLTVEPTMSFWDCGEFIATAYKLEVGHPPGAPLFMIVARIFASAVESNPEQVAFAVNLISVFASSFTILFLFWSITHLGRKLAQLEGNFTTGKMIAVMGSGAVGALAYTFSDSFWFSAVEGEVYAASSLFTAVVFWAILKWESEVTENAKNPLANTGHENRWLLLIAYLMGLSIGVHLLNLLAIPAICFVYYFKKYKVSRWGIFKTLLVSGALLIVIQEVIIKMFVQLAGTTERLFVNDFGMPFNSGLLVYALLVLGLLTYGIWMSYRKNKVVLNTLLLGFVVAIIGYSTFALIVVRSAANPPIDENNPENLFALLSYLNREQYGDRPLLYGQYFNTPTDPDEPYTSGSNTWVKSFSVYETSGKKKLLISCREPYEAEEYMKNNSGKGMEIVQEYVESGEKKNSIPNYDKRFCGVFPRMYSTDARHIREYKRWSNYQDWNTARGRERVENAEKRQSEFENIMLYYQQLGRMPEQLKDMSPGDVYKSLEKTYDKLQPTYGEDARYFFRYQLGWMYWRYFMWNFTGRQDDIQSHGEFQNGNWLSGVDFIDEQRLGNRENLPESALQNKALNKFYFLPLLLGLIGIIFQMIRHPKDFTVVTLLFILTGVAIVVYLNQTPYQPRERDYAYSGSFYSFAIWIGLAVYALFHAATNMTWRQLGVLAAMTLGGSAFIYILEGAMSRGHAFGFSLMYMSGITVALFAVATILNQLKGMEALKATLFTVAGLGVPALMADQGYDDHTRAKRRTGVDFAKNYLDSLAPNAIIFTNGDNDTFPLWYAQEVEEYRTDVRIVNLSLLNTDWYVDQMKRQAYDSSPVPISMTEQKYRQGTRDIVILDHDRNKNDAFIDLKTAMGICEDDSKLTKMGDSKSYNYLPSYKFRIPVDSTVMEQFRPFAGKNDSLVSAIEWSVLDERGKPRPYILKNQLMVLNMLSNIGDFSRPIYFAVTTGPDAYMGLEQYFQLEGLAYRLVPILHEKRPNPNVDGGIACDLMYDNLMNKFHWGNMDTEELYLDENNRRMTTNLRLQFSNLAEELIREDKNDKAIEVLNKAMEVMPERNVPYDRVLLPMIESYFNAGDSLGGKKLAQRLFEINQDEMEYYFSLDKEYQEQLAEDTELKIQINMRMVQMLDKHFADDPDVIKMKEQVDEVINRYEGTPEEPQPAERIEGTPADL